MNAPVQTSPEHRQWAERNQQALTEELSWLRQLLDDASNDKTDDIIEPSEVTAHTLDFLTAQFQLSPFERTIILLCAAMELHSDFSSLCARAQGNVNLGHPTFGLALALLPEAHWSALAPNAPLRYWQFINLDNPSRLNTTRLSIDEHLLHFLLGAHARDSRLQGVIRTLPSTEPLPLTQQQQANHLHHIWTTSLQQSGVIHLSGNDPQGALSVAAVACRTLSLNPMLLHANDIPNQAEEREYLARLMRRECRLSRGVVVINTSTNANQQLTSILEQLDCPTLLIGNKPDTYPHHLLTLEINKPSKSEQLELWHEALVDLSVTENELRLLLSNFDFSCPDIFAIAEEVRLGTPIEKSPHRILGEVARRSARSGLEHLAQWVEPKAGWEDLILPPTQLSLLHGIARQVRHRTTVYEEWGFAEQNGRGLGISTLFTGESGTGKTLAAEVLAGDLGLDLYRIDLSAVVSKYIGETEKNLERLFNAAETSSAVLLFDEADALFGKRSEVKDSRDRYANIEVSYLLQRMETYRGLAILTSNFKTALDTAFHRRFRFIVNFAFPDAAQREAIWKRMFPKAMPSQKLDYCKLAQLNVTGGTIRNIALNAAFLAAHAAEAMNMSHLLHAARNESSKLERPFSETETRGWL